MKMLLIVSLLVVILIGGVGILSTIISKAINIKSESVSDSNLITTGDGNTEYWALIIEAPGWAYASLDATVFYNMLIKRGWVEDNIKTLIGEENATRENILQAIEWLDLKEDSDDVVLIIFAAHGGNIKDEQPLDEPDGYDEYFYLSRGSKITDDELGVLLKNFSSTNMLVIFNSCKSGGMIDGDADLRKSGRVVLTACKANEDSYGLQPFGKSIFITTLTDGFNGLADSDNNKRVTAEEAFKYAAPLTTKLSFGKQHPQIYDGYPTEENNEYELNIIDLSKKSSYVRHSLKSTFFYKLSQIFSPFYYLHFSLIYPDMKKSFL